ncbi:CCA tRNA nucleotidyltransferase [Salimicrobium sp. PL1-032A]|uniref:CCA tRNA nucleotidyltransferase n=1 Tax=Salimicrobium sp. PL1-032A TaxID=3095364 RepID=UPI00326014C8
MNYEQLPLFKLAKEIMEKIEAFGGEAFIVGGCVRDLMLQQQVGDIDIATSLLPEEVMDVFDKVIPVGVEHGTVIVRHQSQSFEVTTYRMEEDYKDYRHPERVYFVSSIEKDLSRRDFTMNAMAMSVSGEIIDPFEGRQAIKKKQIQTVGDASDRFEEDPLRIMRALRFSAQLDFSIDPDIYTVIGEKKGLLAFISVERIAEEWIKLMTSSSYMEGWKNIKNTEVYRYLPVFRDSFALMEAAPERRLTDWAEVISFYHLKQREISVKEWVGAWKLSNRIQKKAEHLAETYELFENKETAQYVVYRLGGEQLKSFQNLTQGLGTELPFDLFEVYNELPIRMKSELEIETREILDVFPERRKGKWIGEYIHALEKSVVQGFCANQRYELIEWVKEWDRLNQN